MRRHLFGGALLLDLPDQFIDASSMRQIPDNQEVFVSSQELDLSFIIEILEDEGLQLGVRDFFKQLGEDNEATDVNVFVEQHVSLSPENPLSTYTPSLEFLDGTQMVAKFKESSTSLIRIFMARIPLPQFKADIIVSFNQTNDRFLRSSTVESPDLVNSFEGFKKVVASSLALLDPSLFNV